MTADEIGGAIGDLERPASDYTRFPWPSLAGLVGGMPGGEICFVGAFSGHGKTTFLSTLTDEVYTQRSGRVYYMGLESRPKTLRTHWACKRLGLDAGDILSGEFLKLPNANAVREQVIEELKSQGSGEKLERVKFCPTQFVSDRNLFEKAEEAADFGATIFVVDHVDHIEGQGNAYEHSVKVSRALLTIAQKHGFLVLPSTQFNNDAVRGSRVMVHTAPQPQFVKNGAHKRDVATWFLGLYKPLKISGVESKALDRFNQTGQGYEQVVEQNCMAVSAMKHRLYGAREGQRTLLAVKNGRVMEPGQFDFRDTRNP
jgi:KaiC/GvpD/RAD55 family RecA-like ATPase